MNVDDVLAEIESERNWREDELRLLHNLVYSINEESERDRYRKALVVMLYAHFEGFTKSAFSIYVCAVNDERLRCIEAHPHLVAAALDKEFATLHDQNRRCPEFQSTCPDDSKIHRYARHVEWVKAIDSLWDRTLEVPAELVVNTESNLDVPVLRKILYRLGFTHDALAAQEGTIHQLVQRRHGVAHGAARAGIDKKKYEDFEQSVREAMSEVTRLITRALIAGAFRTPQMPSAGAS